MKLRLGMLKGLNKTGYHFVNTGFLPVIGLGYVSHASHGYEFSKGSWRRSETQLHNRYIHGLHEMTRCV